jgi:hypothetical protein
VAKQLQREAPVRVAIHVRAEFPIVPNRRPLGEHDLQHRADLLHDRRRPAFRERVPEAGPQLLADLPEMTEGGAVIGGEQPQARARRVQADARRVLCAVVQHAAPRPAPP